MTTQQEPWVIKKCTVQPEYGDMTGYRLLQPDELILEGDEYFHDWKIWKKRETVSISSRLPMSDSYLPHRRKLTEEELTKDWKQGDLLIHPNEYIVEYVTTYKGYIIFIPDDKGVNWTSINNKDKFLKVNNLNKVLLPSGEYYVYEINGVVKTHKV